jgi:hypothetical protein
MKVRTDKEALFGLIDELLVRWRATPKLYPFHRPDSIIPQTIIPDALRKDKEALAVWYIAVCNQMKGRVASMEAFRGNIRIWEEFPWFFNPREVLFNRGPKEIEAIYEKHLPIDKKNNVRGLFWNYRLLDVHYDGKATNLIKKITSYDEAERRLRNKRTQRERTAAGVGGEGMFGFQHKMVSMLVYFYDWERWFKKRFVYPSPADIHNFRIGFTSKSLIVENVKDDTIKDYESISAPWRAGVVEYIVERGEDPVDVADVLWLFSNLMCGNSPMTHTAADETPNSSGMFDATELPHYNGEQQFMHPSYRKALEETCLNCFLLQKCDYAIPARPYYNRGVIVLRKRPKIERFFDLSQIKEPVHITVDEHFLLPLET